MSITKEAHPLAVEAVETAHRYFEYTNGVLGLVAFNLGLASVSTESPRLYGMISLVFVVIAWGTGLRSYRQRLKIVQKLGHKLAKPWAVWTALPVAFIGLLFLSMVTFGALNTHGFARH